LDKDLSENHEWTVWSCKKKEDNSLIYRVYCYLKGALYILKNRNKYDAFFIWQQMVAFILFELLRIIKLKIPNIVTYTFIYDSRHFSLKYKDRLVKNALQNAKALIWASYEMANDVKKKFRQYEHKNYFDINPLFNVIDPNLQVEEALDNHYFRNGIYTAGKSGRDFNIVIRAFRNTDIPVTIVCPDDYPITENNITANIRILPFSKVSPEQYYALAGQAFCILISVDDEKSTAGHLLIMHAMANSIPLIATDSDGVKAYIEKNVNGLLFEFGQSDEIRQCYEKLKNDEEFREKIIKNAKDKAKSLSPYPFMERVLSIIESDQNNSSD
jgi:glycosyltransferase involved in cell wall biosynthesis